MKKAILTALLCACAALPAQAREYGKDQYDKERMASHMVEKMDRNGDHVVSMDEHEAFSAMMFANIDANHDRTLTRDEIAAYKMKDRETRVPKAYKDRDGFNQ